MMSDYIKKKERCLHSAESLGSHEVEQRHYIEDEP